MKNPLPVRGAFRQAGLTLIETLVALAIFALVVAGAIVLFGSASTSQTSTQFMSDLNGIRSGVKGLYYGQGGYGTVSLGEVLINGRKIPASMAITGVAPARVINHTLNGTVTITGNNATFNVVVTAVPTAVCLTLMTGQGWDTIQAGANPVRTVPVTPATASTDCATAATQSLTFVSS